MPRCVAKASKATEEKDLKIKTQGVREKFNMWTRAELSLRISFIRFYNEYFYLISPQNYAI
jgi:hypothetical protein